MQEQPAVYLLQSLLFGPFVDGSHMQNEEVSDALVSTATQIHDTSRDHDVLQNYTEVSGLHIALTKAHDCWVTGRTVSVRPSLKKRIMPAS